MQRSHPEVPQLPAFSEGAPPAGPGWVRPGSSSPPGGDSLFEGTWRILRRHWFLILQAIVVTTIAALVWSATREELYTASTTVLFREPAATADILNTNDSFEDPARRAATNETLLSLGVVADRAAESLRGQVDAGTIAGAVDVVSSNEADIVDVEATTTDPRLSATIANAYSRAFVALRQESAREQMQNAINLARAALDGLTPTEAAGEAGSALRSRIGELETALSLQTGGAEIVQPASAPSSPSSPDTTRNGILGVILGALIGFGLAALRERTDRTVKSVDEVEEAYGQPILARVPRSRSLARGRGLPQRGEEVEAFRALRTSLRFFTVNEELRSLLITSALPAEGKSTTARLLGETMAAMGDRVVLVEADMHSQPGRRGHDGGAAVGLSSVLVGATPLEQALEEVMIESPDGVRALTILPSGPQPPNPSVLLESDRMRDVLDELQVRFDLVIIDSPPIAVLSDALALVGEVSGVIVVSAVGRTTRDAIRDFTRQVDMLGGNLLGVVANFAPSLDRATGSYYQQR